jgi:two-component system cell cycle sensor histidine kinase/response regulator CckA
MAARGTNILIVDDEPVLLESMRVYLSRRGHAVTAFGSAASAWDHFAADPSACSVIIVDLTMPGMSGTELIQKALERSTAVAVLAVSGYPEALRDLNLPGNARLGLLEKPFTPRMLTQALERLLGEEPAGAG